MLIGMQYNQLYIKSKRLGKRCKVRQNCMVNPSSLSEVSQLLMQISSDEETSVI
ncbi:lantibiotic dehydratase [Evtepia gabavorous]|uniref:lantibiotic dehydratase n=1 Tax=Evtepia gabavorous TaxID=2211183 RepID=UPI0039B3DF65